MAHEQGAGAHSASPFPAERELTTPRAAGVAGIVFAVLFVASLVALRTVVGRSLSPRTVIRNVTARDATLAVVGLYMTFFAGLAFLWFMAVLRDRIGQREDKFGRVTPNGYARCSATGRAPWRARQATDLAGGR